MRPIKHDLTGRIFGRLTVTGRCPQRKGTVTKWECKCECGETVAVMAGNLLAKTRSCGCLHAEMLKKPRKHGAAIRSTGPGLTREYRSWIRARVRCYNESCDKFHRYGGRGIVMCESWRKDFSAFLADMGPCPPGHELDRIDNDGPYSPENCRWATRSQQMRNTSVTRFIEHGGRRMALADWAKETGLSIGALTYRLRQGWPSEKVLSH